MSKRLVITIWLSSLLVGLFIAVPTTVNFVNHQKAKHLAIQGCESWWLESKMIPIENLWSRAARLDPAFIPLASAAKTMTVPRQTAERFGYLQQWLDGLHMLDGFCQETMNPNPDKE
jgi:hypothetical protein